MINLSLIGLSSFNAKQQVPSDIATENYFLSPENTDSQRNLNTIQDWSSQNLMKLNCSKTKYMIINFCKSAEFNTRLFIQNQLLEQVEETRILGVILTADLKWHKNTENLVKEANKRMILLRKLIAFDVPKENLIQIYKLYIRSITEQSSVVWSSSITEEESVSLERTQKSALKLIFQSEYISYSNALSMAGLTNLTVRRQKLAEVFADRCHKNSKTTDMFPLNDAVRHTRNPEKFKVPFAAHERLRSSAIPTMARYLNAKFA